MMYGETFQQAYEELETAVFEVIADHNCHTDTVIAVLGMLFATVVSSVRHNDLTDEEAAVGILKGFLENHGDIIRRRAQVLRSCSDPIN